MRQRDAGKAERRAVAEEDLGERPADERVEARAHQRLRSVLARRAAAEVAAHHQDRRAVEAPRIERVVALRLLAVVLEGVLAEPVERDAAQEARGDDAVGVDIVAAQDAGGAGHALDLRLHQTSSRTSTTAPRSAAAATMAGDISSVRPVGEP